MIERKTGYYVWVYGRKTWHRSLKGAMRRYHATKWTNDIEIQNVATGSRVSDAEYDELERQHKIEQDNAYDPRVYVP